MASFRTTSLVDEALSQPVELQWSRLGVATILASQRMDVAYAMGWLHARDRAFQMDLARRSAAGRLAELFGSSALAHDRFQRQLGVEHTAKAAIKHLPAAQREVLAHYVAGVNAYLAYKPFSSLWHALIGRRRMEYWSESSSLLVLLTLYQTLSFDLQGRLTERGVHAALPPSVATFLLPRACPLVERARPAPSAVLEWSRNAAAIRGEALFSYCRDVRPNFGSNCWTVSGERTASGRAMLACDTHLVADLPCPWYRTEARVGDRRFAGVTIPGLPMVLVGSNGSLAWGLTNLPGDSLDLLSHQEAGPLTITESETIHVRGRASVSVRYAATAEGPLLSPIEDQEPLVVRWSGLWPESIDLGLESLAWCDTLDEGVDVARSSGGPPLYFHLAHRSQGTAMTIAGRIPHRSDGRLWLGVYETPEEKPVERGSTSASLVSANDEKSSDSPLHGKGWNHPAGHRAQRIEGLLRTRTDWSEEDFLQVQLDVRAAHLDPFHHLALETLAGPAAAPWPNDLRSRAAKALDMWDGQLSATSVGAPLIQAFADRLADTVLSPFIEACKRHQPDFVYAWRNTEPVVRGLLACEDPILLGRPSEMKWRDCLDHILMEATVALAGRHRRSIDSLRWGDTRRRTMSPPILKMLFGDLVARLVGLSLPGDGDCDCVNALGEHAIPAQRLIVTPGCEERALFSMVGGQSENPLSRHYRDHHRTWFEGRAAGLLATYLTRTNKTN